MHVHAAVPMFAHDCGTGQQQAGNCDKAELVEEAVQWQRSAAVCSCILRSPTHTCAITSVLRLHVSEPLCRLLPSPALNRNDEQAFKRTDTAQRRAEMERRAHERAEAEAQRLREQAATAHREEREEKLNALHDLNLQVSRSGSSSSVHRSAERAWCEQLVMQGLASWHCTGSTRPIQGINLKAPKPVTQCVAAR